MRVCNRGNPFNRGYRGSDKSAQADYIARASAGKLGKKIRLYVELYDVKTSGLIGIHDELYDNFSALYNAIDKNLPGMFKEIANIPAAKAETPAAVPSKAIAAPAKAAAEPRIQNQSGSFADSRDGKTYKYIKIGGQVWMAENLNYNASGSKCYENKPENCAKYGRLYNWNTAKAACPNGWHLPSKEEWDALADYIEKDKICSMCDAEHLKAKNGWEEWGTPYRRISGNGHDSYGFAALPGGVGFSDGSFSYAGGFGDWRSADEDDGFSYYRHMYNNDSGARWYENAEAYLFSVRCVKD